MLIRLSAQDSKRLLDILGVDARQALRRTERRRRIRIGVLLLLLALVLAGAVLFH